MSTQSIQNKIKSLENSHRKLDNDIKWLYSHSYAEEEIKILKKKKLRLKEQIELLKKKEN